jgi:hypothetical protein
MAGESERPPRSDDEEKKRLIERVVPELVKRMLERAVESGVERLSEGPENLRNFVGELKLPKEVIKDLYAQIDDTKLGLYKVVAKEIRDVLEQTQLAEEIAKVLTKLSFEIKTEIRFIPNDAAAARDERDDDDEDDDEGEPERRRPTLRPSVTSEVKVRDRNQDPRRGRRRREDP